MSESIFIALLAALGVVSSATISVSSGRRLKRLEAVSNVLKDLPADDEARPTLLAIRIEDAVELRREQRSTLSFFLGTSTAGLVLSIILFASGDAVRAWSPAVYLILVGAFAVAALALVTAYIAIAALYVNRWIRKIGGWVRTRRAARGAEVVIEDAASGV